MQPGGADVRTWHHQANSVVVRLSLLVRFSLGAQLRCCNALLVGFWVADSALIAPAVRNEPVLDFIMAIEQHAKVRGIADAAWWVW